VHIDKLIFLLSYLKSIILGTIKKNLPEIKNIPEPLKNLPIPPPMSNKPITPNSFDIKKKYDDYSGDGFDYAASSLSLNATAAPYAPTHHPPIISPPVPTLEYQGKDFSPRLSLNPSINTPLNSSLNPNQAILHPQSLYNDIPSSPLANLQQPSLDDLSTMLNGITKGPSDRSNSFSMNQYQNIPSVNMNDFFGNTSRHNSLGGIDYLGGFSSSFTSGIIGNLYIYIHIHIYMYIYMHTYIKLYIICTFKLN
jgi:hypothetical protein